MPIVPAIETRSEAFESIAILLERIAPELDRMADLVLGLQTTVGTMTSAMACSNETIKRLQDLDLIAQTLHDLAAVNRQTALTVAKAERPDIGAISAICRLSALGSRLRGDDFASGSSADTALELF